MKHTSSILLIIGASLALLTACATKRDKGYVADDDPEMVAAIAKARRTLPLFWQAYEQRDARAIALLETIKELHLNWPADGKRDPGETQFSLKIRITDGEHLEHFWATEFLRQDGKVIVTINQAPKIVANVKLGDRLEIPEAEIQDWYYMRGGKMIGNQTIRPMLRLMPAKTAAEFKALLEDP